MRRYVIQRLVASGLTLLGVSCIIFVDGTPPARRPGRRHRAAMTGLLVLGLMLVLVLTVPLWTSHDPTRQQLSQVLRPLSTQHLFGTDHLGSAMLARLMSSGRLSLLIGGVAVSIGLRVSVPLGALSGFHGGLTDLLIQRLADVLLSFPGLAVFLAVLGLNLLVDGLRDALGPRLPQF